MAQVNEQSITLGSGRMIGKASVDSAAVRGEGGPLRPQLVVPLTITLNPQPDEAMLAITGLVAQLGTDPHPSAPQIICQPTSHQFNSGFPAHTNPKAPYAHTESLRFFLTSAEVEDIERRRHAANADVFHLYLGLEVAVAAVRMRNTFGPDAVPETTPWDFNFGSYSEVMPFWTSRVEPVWVQIEQSSWVRAVLPGLGHDRLRLLELQLPLALPDHLSAAAQFDKAKRALDERRYGDCIQHCRGLLNMWEKQYGATERRRTAAIVAEARQWAAGDIRSSLLDALWKTVGDVANAPHHPEGNVDSELFDERDARLVLILTAALSEYVGHVGRGPLTQ